MAYTGKKPIDHTDVTQSQSMTVTDDLTVDTNTLHVDSTNNRVGIGTISPTQALELNFTGYGGMVVNSTDNAGQAAIRFDSTSGAQFNQVQSAHMEFRTADTERMRIDSTGNVGIGTSPAQKLHLQTGGTTYMRSENTGISTVTDFGTDSTGSIIINRSAKPMRFFTDSAERMRVDSSGNVGVGTASPVGHGGFASGRIVEVKNSGNAGTAADNSTISITSSNRHAGLSLESGANRNGYVQFGDPDDDDVGGITYVHGANALTFKTNASEAMRIDSSGNVLVGTTTAYGQVVSESGSSKFQFASHNTDSSGASQISFRFVRNSADVGSITTDASGIAFNSLSDYRLKENVTGITDGIERVKQLNPSRFNFIIEPDRTVDGFLAHEAQTVVPEAITGEKDAMRDEEYEVTPATGDIFTPASAATFDEDGNELTAATDEVIHSAGVERPDELADGQEWRETTAAVMGTRTVPDYQGIDQSKLVPLLTAALKEAIAKIETLETKVAALEAE